MRPILVHFAPKTLKRLDAVCRRTMIPRAVLIRRAVDNALDPKFGVEAQIILAAEKAAEERSNAEDRENGGGK